MILWIVWYRRNLVRVKDEDYPVSKVVPNALQALEDFRRANQAAVTQSATSSSPQVRCSPPPPNYLKVNFDGATFKEIGKAGIGVVIRDSQGQVLASLSKQVDLPFSSDMVEAQAAARAMAFTEEIGCPPFILEGDSEAVIKTLNSEEERLSPSGQILSAAKNMTETIVFLFLMYVELVILWHII